ncbi:hypothetical protein [Aquimarina algiphila]|nr:hypothetical protein [Aquimarina algiphila]
MKIIIRTMKEQKQIEKEESSAFWKALDLIDWALTKSLQVIFEHD